jgi:hypothetical protein
MVSSDRKPVGHPVRLLHQWLALGPDVRARLSDLPFSARVCLSSLRPWSIPSPAASREAGRSPSAVSTKFEMVVNRKTATALSLTIPASILLRATEVIE